MEEDEDDSINSSPTPVSARSSKRLRQRRSWEASKLHNASESATAAECDRTQETNEEVNWFEVDRLDCQRALEEPLRPRAIPASQNFLSLKFMLESQQLPQEEAAANPTSIVEQILQDFCGSPSFDQDEQPTYYVSPQFRFYNKTLRTYSRHRPLLPTTSVPTRADDDDDDDVASMSCSSDLSVQEHLITQLPMANHCDFDANSSQRICENLLNLSAFFTQNNPNNSIDLPANAAHSDIEAQDASDILKDNGYFIGNTEDCKILEDNADTTAAVTKELSLFTDQTHLAAKETPEKADNKQEQNLFVDCLNWFASDLSTQEVFEKAETVETNGSKQQEENEFLEDIPFSEWQPMDMPNEAPKSTENPQVTSNACNQLEEIPWSEWQPTYTPDSVEFRTASNKTIEVSEEQQREAHKLMADLESSYSQKAKKSGQEIMVEFRTASNKTVKLTEDMRNKAAMLMSDLEPPDGIGNDLNPLEQSAQFRTASNRSIKITEHMQKAANNLLADLELNLVKREADILDEIPLSEWQPMEISQEKKTNTNDCSSQLDVIPMSEWQPLDLPDGPQEASKNEQQETSYSQSVGQVVDAFSAPVQLQFRTAGNRSLELTEEMRRRAATLMADLEIDKESTETVGFRSASNKTIKVSEEHQQKALKLMKHVENSYSQTHSAVSDHPVELQFRTAGNRALELTEEMRRRAATLMADLETERESTKSFQETVGFRSASNKTIKVSEEHQQKALKLMEHVENSYSQAHSAVSDHPVELQFRTAGNRALELTEEMRRRAATLMADLETVQELTKDDKPDQETMEDTTAAVSSSALKLSPAARNECDVSIHFLTTATPKPTYSACTSINSVFETPKSTPEMQDSLTQLSERSPLDKDTKSSIITRRNLLSLNKRRKSKRDAENQRQFTPMAAATSTPVPSRKESKREDLHSQCKKRERRCSQETPRVQDNRVGKRRSEEALSPIYAPTNKTRRLGLSRLRNKSSNDI